jgi:sodium transport system permease protein
MKLITIVKKELLDQMRDRRTIIAAIFMPAVIVPLLLFSVTYPVSGDKADSLIRIIIDKNESELKQIIHNSLSSIHFLDSDGSESVLNGSADIQITAGKNGNKYRSVMIHYDSARTGSSLSFIKIHSCLESYFRKPQASQRETEIKSSAVRGEKESRTILTLSFILPVLLMVFAASSSMSAVIDMTAGEKERSTLENLLSCNISHFTIISGKILASWTIGFLSVLSLLCGLTASSVFFPELAGGLSLTEFFSVPDILLLTVSASIAVLFFSSAGMVIGLYARSAKEGTILTLPVIILSSALSSGLISGDPFQGTGMHLLIPVLNLSHIIRGVIFNHNDYFSLTAAFSASTAYILLFIFFGSRLIKKENVIFRS